MTKFSQLPQQQIYGDHKGEFLYAHNDVKMVERQEQTYSYRRAMVNTKKISRKY